MAAVTEIEKKIGALTALDELSKSTEERLGALNSLSEHVSLKVKALEGQRGVVERAIVESNRLNEMVWAMDAQIAKLNDGRDQMQRTEEAVSRMEELAQSTTQELTTATAAREEFLRESSRLEVQGRSIADYLRSTIEKLSVDKKEFDAFDQRLGKLGFWLVFTGILGLGFVFAIGGTVQVFVYRTLGLDWFGGDVGPAMLTMKLLVPLFGLVFAVGVCAVVFDLLTMGIRTQHAIDTPDRALAPLGWARRLQGWEAGVWLLFMWIFGAIITLGLLSFNLRTVQEGNAMLPYIMGGVGYSGLLLTTLFFVARFLRSLDARTHESTGPSSVLTPALQS